MIGLLKAALAVAEKVPFVSMPTEDNLISRRNTQRGQLHSFSRHAVNIQEG
jgi:hypothetical protein